MAVVRNLIIRAGADFSAMREQMNRAQRQVHQFKNNIKTALAGIAGITVSLGIGAALNDAMKFEASVQQLTRLMGESSKEFMKWADTTATAFNMSRSEAVQYGATFSNIISTFAKSTKETQKYTQDLLQATAVAASMTGRTMEDALERVRSGMLGNTEAIEDLGIFVNVSMIESTKAFQQFANNKSWAQLDFQTQQQIRLFAILEQAATKYGIEVGNNAISATARFTAQLNNFKLAIGQAFKPIWEAVLPGLTAMVAWLTRAANAVAQFMTVLFGKAPVKQAQTQVSVNNQVASSADSIGDSYKQAGKEAKKAAGSLAAFDEINSLAEKNMSGSEGLDGGAGGGLLGDITSVMPSITPVNFETNALEISEKIKELATKFKEYLKPLSPYVEKVKTSFNNLKTAISDLVSIPAIQKFVDFMKEKSIDLFKGKLLELSGRFDMLAGFIETVSAVLSGDWEKALKGNEKIISGLYDIITGTLYPFFPEFAKKMEEFKANFSEKWASLKEEVRKYGDPAKLEALDFGKYIAVEVTKKFAELVINTRTKFQELKNAISEKWELIKTDIAWNDVKNNLLLKWDELKTNSAAKWDSIKATLSEKWGLIKSTIGWSDVKNTLVSHWEALKTSTGTKWSELKTVISNKWDDIKALKLDDVKIGLINIWNGLKTETEIIWRAIEGVIKQGINSVLDLINSLIDKMNSVEIKIPSVNLPGIGKIGGNSIKLPTIPKLPKLARGGIVDGTSNMGNYIAGEAGAEMIVPLENTSFVDKLASALGTAVMSAMSFSNESANNKGDFILQIDGVTLGRVMNPYLTKENNRVGTPVIKTI